MGAAGPVVWAKPSLGPVGHLGVGVGLRAEEEVVSEEH